MVKGFVVAIVLLTTVSAKAQMKLASGIAAFEKGEYRKAIAILKDAEKESPEDFNVNFYLGVAFARLSNYVSAEEYLLKSLEIIPDSTRTLYEYSLVALNLGKYDKAIESIKKASQLDSTFIPKLDYIEGIVALKRGNLAKAEEAFREVIRKGDSKMKKKAEEALEITRKMRRKWKIRGITSLALVYNSNVLINEIGVQHERKWDTQGSMSALINFSYAMGRFSISAGYGLTGDFHTELLDYDFYGHLVRPSLSYKLSRSASLNIKNYFQAYYINRELFLLGDDIEVSVSLKTLGTTNIGIGAGYSDYRQPEVDGYDGAKIYLLIEHTFKVENFPGTIGLNLPYKSAKGTGLSHFSVSPYLSAEVEIGSFLITTGFSYSLDRYRGEYPQAGVSRADDILSVETGMGIKGEILKWSIIWANFTSAKSNINDFTYDILLAGTKIEIKW